MRSAMLRSYASRDPFNDLSRESLTYLWNTMANPISCSEMLLVLVWSANHDRSQVCDRSQPASCE
jgi:hypothetical protein